VTAIYHGNKNGNTMAIVLGDTELTAKVNPVTPMSIFAFLGIGGSVGILGWVLAHAYKPKTTK
jgi:hypothetical protein